MTNFDIENSVAFVTGTNKKNGIGRAIVESLIEHGASKVYATARDASQLDDLVAKYDGKAVAVALDVTDLEAIEKLGEKYPDVTLVVNNAGYAGFAGSTAEVGVVQKEIQINYVAPFAIVKSFASNLNKEQTAVVNIGSIASFVNFPAAGTYSASKTAVHSLTQAQRRDMPKSVVIGVYPGPIDTAMAEGIPMDKAPPSVVAQEVVNALQNGIEDVFPDSTAKNMFDGWKADFKAMEKHMAMAQ